MSSPRSLSMNGNSGAMIQRSRPTSPKPRPSSMTAFHSYEVSHRAAGVAMAGSLAHSARRRTPLGAIRLLFEMRARDEILIEVFRVGHDRRHHEPFIAVGRGEAIEVFRDRRVFAVRHAVPAKPARPELSSHDLETAA